MGLAVGAWAALPSSCRRSDVTARAIRFILVWLSFSDIYLEVVYTFSTLRQSIFRISASASRQAFGNTLTTNKQSSRRVRTRICSRSIITFLLTFGYATAIMVYRSSLLAGNICTDETRPILGFDGKDSFRPDNDMIEVSKLFGVDIIEDEVIIRQSLQFSAHFIFTEGPLPPRHSISFMLFDAKVCNSDNPNRQESNPNRDKIPG